MAILMVKELKDTPNKGLAQCSPLYKGQILWSLHRTMVMHFTSKKGQPLYNSMVRLNIAVLSVCYLQIWTSIAIAFFLRSFVECKQYLSLAGFWDSRKHELVDLNFKDFSLYKAVLLCVVA